MATHTITIELYSSVKARRSVYNVTVSPTSLTVKEGDIVTFKNTYIADAANDDPVVTIDSFASGNWNSTSKGYTYASNPTLSRTAEASTGSDTIYITLPTRYGSASNPSITFTPNADIIPDSMVFADVNNAQFSTTYYSDLHTIAGMDSGTSIPLSVSGGYYSKNGGSYTTGNSTCVLGDTFVLRDVSPSAFDQTSTVTLTHGTSTSTFDINTPSNFSANPKIPLGITSGTIKSSDVHELFTGGYIKRDSLYLRGGAYVPYVSPENDGIPTALPLAMRDFLGCVTVLTLDFPGNYVDFEDTSGGSVTVSRFWNMYLFTGYGAHMYRNCEYRHEIVVTASGGASVDDVTVTGTNTWGATNDQAGYSVSGNYEEGFYTINVRTYVRHKVLTSAQAYVDYQGRVFLFGP